MLIICANLHLYQAIRLFFNTHHIAQEGSEAWPLRDALAKSEGVISELKTDQQRLESEAELRRKEVEDLRNQVNSLTTTSDSLRAALIAERTAKDLLQTALT